ncbi:MAG: hypothetical protein IPM82_09090 [Saprospiraceae bacterium]|nr:hypothetical protein [Saprospiraceae bacterium]
MASKHQVFIENYLAESDRFQQLTMLKEYMLSLPVEDLLEFTMEPIKSLGEELEGGKLTKAQRKHLTEQLEEMATMLRMKAVA